MQLMRVGVLALTMGLAGVHATSAGERPLSAPILLASYTQNLAGSHAANVIPVRLNGAFSAAEQTDIAQALEEWNYALNGHLRYDLQASAEGPALTITRVPEKGMPTNGPSAQWLAVTLRTQGDGGLILVYGDRIGSYDLRRIMLHEFGHLLGLEHDDKSSLMFPRYLANRQRCVDRATVEKLASQRNWQIEAMNWCESPIVVARARIENGSEFNAEPNTRQSRTGHERRMSRGTPSQSEEALPEFDPLDAFPELILPHDSGV